MLIDFREFMDQYVHGPAIGDGVVQRQDEDMVAEATHVSCPQFEKASPDQRPDCQIEGLLCFRRDEPPHHLRMVMLRFASYLYKCQVYRQFGRYPLNRLPVDEREACSENFMPSHDLP